MRAVVISKGEVSWSGYEAPKPSGSELLVRVQAAGLNGADLHQLAGHYPAPPGVPPDIPGLELAGVVEEAGPRALRYRAGDRVMALVQGGAQAELCLVDEHLAIPVPDQLNWEEAGGFTEAFATAHDALITQAGLAAGERLLVTGAAGGVGLAGVQLGLAAGAEVVASVRRAELRNRVAELGATAAAPEEVVALGPYDVVLELVGAPNLSEDLASLAPWGRVVVIGIGGGSRSELDLRLVLTKRARLLGSTLRARSLEERALVMRRVEHQVLPLLERGKVKVLVEAAFRFAEADAAYSRFAAGGKFGKVVLVA